MRKQTSPKPRFVKTKSRNKSKPSPELKIFIGVVVILGVLLAYDFTVSPDDTTAKVSAVTGSVVADVKEVIQESEPTLEIVQEAAAPPKLIYGVEIVSPEPGSVQTGEFAVKVLVSPDANLCYYQIRDDGSVTWDRRTRNCGQDVIVKESFCKTKGKDKCYVLYTADANDVYLGQAEAYYTIE